MFSYISFALYRYFLIPTGLFFLNALKPFFSEKVKIMINSRQRENFPPLQAKPIWIHASSGEIEYAKSVIREIKLKWPQQPILVTYFSPSALKLLKNFRGVDAIVPLPWDSKQKVKEFLNFYKPKALLISRTDVWPELAYQCRLRNIPSLLFSATISSNSSRNNIFSSPLTRFSMNQLTDIYCVDEEDFFHLQRLGTSTPISKMGDSRFDQVFYRIQNPNSYKNHIFKNNECANVLACGSTWPEDEKIIFSSIISILEQDYRIIIAPHEISEQHLFSITQQLHSLKIDFELYSQTEDWKKPVLIIDQVGSLQEIYSHASVAFVGGSFKDKVHSVMEPLCLGLPVIVGPHYINNREAAIFTNFHLPTKNTTAVSICSSADQFIRNLIELKNTDSKSKDFIINKCFKMTGATQSVVDWTETQINKT